MLGITLLLPPPRPTLSSGSRHLFENNKDKESVQPKTKTKKTFNLDGPHLFASPPPAILRKKQSAVTATFAITPSIADQLLLDCDFCHYILYLFYLFHLFYCQLPTFCGIASQSTEGAGALGSEKAF